MSPARLHLDLARNLMAWIVIRTDAGEELVAIEIQPPAGDWDQRVSIEDHGVAEYLAKMAVTNEMRTITSALGAAMRKDAL